MFSRPWNALYICFVLRSSGKFKTRLGVTLILGCCFFMISQVQFIMRHCVHNLFSNLTRKYIYMPFVIQSGFNSYQCMMNTWISGWLKIQMNNIEFPRFSSVKWIVRSIAISDKTEEWNSWNLHIADYSLFLEYMYWQITEIKIQNIALNINKFCYRIKSI